MKRKDELQDIYRTEASDPEKDFQPQVAEESLQDRQRELLRARVASLLLGGLAILLTIVLLTLVVRGFLFEQAAAPATPIKNKVVALHRTPPAEDAWVMDYEYDEKLDDAETGSADRPVSTKWIKKAAYHTIMGQQELALNNLPAALSQFQQVVDIYSNIQGIHQAMGELYLQTGDAERAAEHFEKALLEEETFNVVNRLGQAYLESEQYSQAESSLLRALELKPESPMCHKNLAELYREMGREKDAVFHFEKYLDLVPGDIETLQAYALYLTKISRWKEAVEFLRVLTQEIDDVAPLYFLLAQAQTQVGNSAAAIEALNSGAQLVDPVLALDWMSRDDFNSLRKLKNFQALVNQLEASITD